MVALSQLLRFHVSDDRGGHSRLVDVSVPDLEADDPIVDRLLLRCGRQGLRLLPWTAVTAFDRKTCQLRVADVEAGELVRAGDRPAANWLERDVLDATIINLWHRHVSVANDLWLSGDRRGLRLRAVATGPRAILSRLTGWFYNLHLGRSLYAWRHIVFICGDPRQAGAVGGAYRRLARLPAGEIAYLATPLPYLQAAELIQHLPEALAADTLEEMPLELALQIFEELTDARAQAVLARLAPDVAADLLGRLDAAAARRHLERLPHAQSGRLIELLRYPPNTVGGAMTNDLLRVTAGLTVGRARQALHQRLKEPDFPYFLYAVDNDQQQHLVGVLTLRAFAAADDDCRISDLMNHNLLKLTPLAAPRQAAHRVLESGLAALPVVSSDGRLLGALTVDNAVSLLAPRSWRAQAPRVFS